jgi:hypothetical protein
MKEHQNQVAHPSSLKSGVVVSDLRSANVIHVFKKE